jgi:hypothetical protein
LISLEKPSMAQPLQWGPHSEPLAWAFWVRRCGRVKEIDDLKETIDQGEI